MVELLTIAFIAGAVAAIMLMRPYLLAASHSTKITKNVELSTKNQPVLVMTQFWAELEADPRPGVLTMPQTTKATATIPVIQNTAGSILLRQDV